MSSSFNNIQNFFVSEVRYKQGTGENPVPICIAIKNITTGKVDLVTAQDQKNLCNHLMFDEKSAVATFQAVPFLKLIKLCTGQYPSNVIDLYVEHKRFTNGLQYHDAISKNLSKNGSLLKTTNYWNSQVKHDFSSMNSKKIFESVDTNPDRLKSIYTECLEDLELNAKLFSAQMEIIKLEEALVSGVYLKTCAEMEINSIPIDVKLKNKIKKNYDVILKKFRKKINKRLPVFRENGSLNHAAFLSEISKRQIEPVITRSGAPCLMKSVLESYALKNTELADFETYQGLVNKRDALEIPIGADGRNRFERSEYGTITGRDAPSTVFSILLKPKYLRQLIKPPKDCAIIYADYIAQEQGVAAAFSQDKNLIDDYRKGDLYLNFCKEIKLIPSSGDKHTHPEEFRIGKKAFNCIMNGMGLQGVKVVLGKTETFASKAIAFHKKRYSTYWKYIKSLHSFVSENKSIKSAFAWTLHIQKFTSYGTITNFPMQANGADINRLACVMCFENNLKIISALHDSIMIESTCENSEKDADLLKRIMIEASRIVLGGFSLDIKMKIIKYPERFEVDDPKAKSIWNFMIDAINSPTSDSN